MPDFSALYRQRLLNRLSAEFYDLLVIGGGITGAGIALDAALRGIRVALIEQQDFAAGTSSRSTKLIHGGLRYLKQLEIKLVQEVGSERAIVHRIAPHLVVAEKMLLPLVRNGSYGKSATSFGLWVYDVLAGVRPEDRRVMLSRAETLAQEPLLRPDLVLGGGLYAEYRSDDARLTIELLKTASQRGADCANYLEAKQFLYEGKRLAGVLASDCLSGQSLEIRARQVVSAAGPWVDELRRADGSLSGKRLHLTKGVHLVFPYERLPLRQSAYFDVPGGRMIFAIPRGRTTYVGTTDTDYRGPKEEPPITTEDVDYLLAGVNHLFPSLGLSRRDVESGWAGLRPLIHQDGKSASELSRKDEIFESPAGLISIAGGKLTGYRKMAERVVNRVAARLAREGRRFAPSSTASAPLCGGDFGDAAEVEAWRSQTARQLGPLAADAANLVHLYGRQTAQILARAGQDPCPEALLRALLQFSIEEEMTHSAADFFVRRTGMVYFHIARVRAQMESALAHMQQQLGWDAARLSAERQALEQALRHASEYQPASAYAPA
jgi:glycerol-3-phosphate dehydrogenase